jgi:hypothetical protein
MEDEKYLLQVRNEISRYEHPLFEWEATQSDQKIKVSVRLKQPGIHDDPYIFYLTRRELDAHAFQWDFQRQLYNYLHDYLIEMFTRSPHINEY